MRKLVPHDAFPLLKAQTTLKKIEQSDKALNKDHVHLTCPTPQTTCKELTTPISKPSQRAAQIYHPSSNPILPIFEQ